MSLLPPTEWSDYRLRLQDERGAGWLTPGQLDVLETISRLVLQGDDDPTVARIAVEAQVSPSTVRRARRKAEERGLLVTHARFAQVEDRRRQITNRYELATPTTPCVPRGSQADRPSGVERKKEADRRAGEEPMAPLMPLMPLHDTLRVLQERFRVRFAR
jgi:transposase-like protein